MRKTFLINRLILITAISVHSSQLLQAHLVDNGKNVLLEFVFAQDSPSSRIPKFFQQYSSQTGLYSINFLETTTPISFGLYEILKSNSFARQMTLQSIQRKKGGKIKNFLSFSFKVSSHLAKSKYSAFKTKPSLLTLDLGESEGNRYRWTVSPSTEPSSVLRTVSGESQLDSGIAQKLDSESQPESNPEDQPKIQEVLGTKSALELGKNIDEEEQKEIAASSKTFSIVKKEIFIVLDNQINLRKGSGTSADIVRKLDAGLEVIKVGKKNNWLKVTVQGDTGFIRQDLLASKQKITLKQRQSIEEKNALKKKEEQIKFEEEEKIRKAAEILQKKKKEKERMG